MHNIFSLIHALALLITQSSSLLARTQGKPRQEKALPQSIV
jgi:hypothetical protein